MNITNAYYLVPRDDDGNIISGADAIGVQGNSRWYSLSNLLDSANTTYAEIQKQIIRNFDCRFYLRL